MKRVRPTRSLILRRLYNMHKDIILIYRPTKDDGWSNRCKLYSKEYKCKVPYNHRTILPNEIVLEYDLDNEINNTFSNKVWSRLHGDGLLAAKYFSGNKSKHIHLFLKIPEGISDLATLKRVFMRHYGVFYYDRAKDKYLLDRPQELMKEVHEGKERIRKVYPDMQLAGNHPIRMEFGVHEKTGKMKSLERWDTDYMKPQEIPKVIFTKYVKEKERLMRAATTRAINKIDEETIVKDILNTVKFKEDIGDGRERLLFCLTHILKHKHEKEELKTLLYDWYRYSGGRKLSKFQVDSKVDYHYPRDYTITLNYLNSVVEDL